MPSTAESQNGDTTGTNGGRSNAPSPEPSPPPRQYGRIRLYCPTPQSYAGPFAKYNNAKGNPPFIDRKNNIRLSDELWDKEYNNADSRRGKFHERKRGGYDLVLPKEIIALRAMDRWTGRTRADAIAKLIEKGVLDQDYVDCDSEY